MRSGRSGCGKTTVAGLPAGIGGRVADNWRPLIAIADLVGGQWPARARLTAKAFAGRVDEQFVGIMLLDDVRTIFAKGNAAKISSEHLAEHLAGMEERPWPEWRNGKPISKTQVAKLLVPFGIRPKTVRISTDTAKGYTRESFEGAFARYLEPEDVTPSQPAESAGSVGEPIRNARQDVTDVIPATPAETADCDGVTAEQEAGWEEWFEGS